MTQSMEGKVALVTGGTSGIGRATAVAFARKGANVVVCGRREAEGQQTIDMVHSSGSNGLFIQTDVTNEAAVQSLIEQTVDHYGQLDYAFNNAGISGTPRPIAEGDLDELRQVIEVNLIGTWLCMKYEIQQMLRQGSGAIVNMASVAGIWGTPGIAPYVAAKHGVVGITKTVAMEYASAGLRINVVGPAGIHTEILDNVLSEEAALERFAQAHPIQRLGQPEEVANTVVWLCSNDAPFITGSLLMIDGAITAGTNPFL